MNEIVIAKFGGSSLSDSSQFVKVKEIISADERRRYIVPSAPGKRSSSDIKITDCLYQCFENKGRGRAFDDTFAVIEKRYADLCRQLRLEIDIAKYLADIKKEIITGASRDYAASRGEYLSGLILAEYLGFEFVDAADMIIFRKNGLLDEKATYRQVRNRLANINRAVIPGFYGAYADGKIKTFSRGGSDITGAIIARSMSAKIYENWTDVSGLLMADPRIVNNPKPIAKVTYKELRELSYMGANVFHEDAIFPVINNDIPINIKNTNRPYDKGTLIINESCEREIGCITGISGKKDFTVITVGKSQMNRSRGYCQRVFSVLEKYNTEFEYIPSGVDTVSLLISNSEYNDTIPKISVEIQKQCRPDFIEINNDIALVAVVAKDMAKTPYVISKVLSALSKCNLSIKMVNQCASGLSIIIGIENKNFENAINAIYYSFESDAVSA